VLLPVIFIIMLFFYLTYPDLAWRLKDFKMELVEGFDRGSVNYINRGGGGFTWFLCRSMNLALCIKRCDGTPNRSRAARYKD
jgi:hypothetical protein